MSETYPTFHDEEALREQGYILTSEELETELKHSPECSSLCHPDEECAITESGHCPQNDKVRDAG